MAFVIYPTNGGHVKPTRGISSSETPLQWDADGRKLYVWDGTLPQESIVWIRKRESVNSGWKSIRQIPQVSSMATSSSPRMANPMPTTFDGT